MPGGLPLWEATSKDQLHRERQRDRAITGPKIGEARRARSTCSTLTATLFDRVEDFQLSADFRNWIDPKLNQCKRVACRIPYN
jgi:hypothetical protein